MKIHHICIQTNNYKRSLEFYCSVLNFKLENETKDFHNREFNSWLSLDGFYIELQTAKYNVTFNDFNNETESLSHFCLYSDDFDSDFNKIEQHKLSIFKKKNGYKIYNIENKRLFKIIAPEGTVIEVRDSLDI